MEISTPLQVALFLASIAVIILAAWIIFISFAARTVLKKLSCTAEEVKADLEVLVQHSHELISNVTEVSRRVSQQVDEVETVVRTVRQWTERVDRIVEEVGSAIEPPVFTAVRRVNIFRKGAGAFLRALFHFDEKNGHNVNVQQGEEGHHV